MLRNVFFILILAIFIFIAGGCKKEVAKEVEARFVINDEVIEDIVEGLWVEVALKEEGHIVIVRENNKIKKEMICSGGTKEEPTLLGTFSLENRGLWFYSERFKEGAKYWVRITEQYLFHGIPRDKDWNIIKEEQDKLGKPASHGCIRLGEEDAQWFYENVPDGTTVIIHE
ncbi:L,D-transpeptidase [Vallitalea sp.]|jgi:lipoprotein-anchoring transpeptidase ErfK/SrfK|uniref:L,D-transpeptidase n=1 Tax=Vallitalea sp. TaxID=1882829 RepID=UPI0025DCF3C6|nr:L,D-transpeptidase [Vallitalea sp.]MCT4686178.1 L,D-transpeptidase [Vallitalea sp.]